MLWLLILGCAGKTGADTAAADTAVVVDADGDGFDEATDCDDSDAGTHPGADEVCDEADNDCDGTVDEGVTTTFYTDADGDGYGAEEGETVEDCDAPDGYAATPADCNDADAAVSPGAEEECDGVDNNCNEVIDEGVRLTFYRDADGDGFGDPERESESCAPTDGTVEDDTDCDDDDATVYPGAEEIPGDGIDNDCDGSAKLTGG